MKKPVYRHELKYRINLPDWALLRSRQPSSGTGMPEKTANT